MKRAIPKDFTVSLHFKPWPPKTLGAGFRQEWVTASSKQLTAGIDTGAGLGNPMLTFWIERSGKRQYFDADIQDILRAAIAKATQS